MTPAVRSAALAVSARIAVIATVAHMRARPTPCAPMHHDKLPRVQTYPVRSPVFFAALLVGLLIRLAALQLPVIPNIALRTEPLFMAFDGGQTAVMPGGWHLNALIKLPGLLCTAALTVLF